MIAITLLVAAIVYVAMVTRYGTQITPDGAFYGAMGRGAFVPRPYSLRTLPILVGSVMAWRVIHAVSFLTFAVCSHIVADAMGVSGLWCAVGVLTLPFVRQSVVWPVLLDMPMLAVAALAAAVATVSPVFAVVIVALSVLIHERAPVWSAIYAAPFVPWEWLAFAACTGLIFAAVVYTSCETHPDEQRIEWLRSPLASAWARHAPTLHDPRVWLLPLGVCVLGALWGWWPALALVVGYAGCLVAQDRARIYGVACLPLAIGVMHILPVDLWPLLALNWFVSTTEV